MKRFIYLGLIFTLGIIFCSTLIVACGIYTRFIPGREIYNAIKKSKKHSTLKKLVIGDSTANQFYNNREEDDSLYSLACNQAIGVCGHFFLLKNYLEEGNRPEEVYMVYNALSFRNDLNQVYTFHYFLKPFYNNEYKPLMSPTMFRQIEKIPYHEICQFPLILMSSWAPEYTPKESECSFLSHISREYLDKIDSLSIKYGFKLYIVPSLMAKSKEKQIKSIRRDEFSKERYANKLITFLDNVKYIDDEYFSDGTHLKNPLEFKYMVESNIKIVKKAYLAN